jgi:N-methylhydantoinase A
MSPVESQGRLRIAVDIGGTFTDLAAFDEASGELKFGKALSTHGALVDGIQHAADGPGVSFGEGSLFLHGSTIAINTLLERTGAQTALLITRGFRDIYEIGRINRPDAYNLFFGKHEPLVQRSWRFEINERLRADGSDTANWKKPRFGRWHVTLGIAGLSRLQSCCCIRTATRHTSSGSKR